MLKVKRKGNIFKEETMKRCLWVINILKYNLAESSPNCPNVVEASGIECSISGPEPPSL